MDSHKPTFQYEAGLPERFGGYAARIKTGNSLVMHAYIRTQTRQFALDPTKNH
jgi:hypothetical protein